MVSSCSEICGSSTDRKKSNFSVGEMANVIYSNQANKIFIYNSAQEEVNNDEDMDTKNTSSITILTSGMPEYHIRIKSNFKNGNSKNSTDEDEKLKTQTEEHSDMKTLDRSYFESGEDVLLKSIDDKLYLGTIVDIKNENYLVKFDDNTEKWARKKDLKKLNNSSNLDECKDKSLCVICKIKDVSDKIKTCGKCCRGYHSACLSEPPTTTSPWCCDRCVTAEVISISDSEENDNCLEGEKVTLPYDVRTSSYLFEIVLSRIPLPDNCTEVGQAPQRKQAKCILLLWNNRFMEISNATMCFMPTVVPRKMHRELERLSHAR